MPSILFRQADLINIYRKNKSVGILKILKSTRQKLYVSTNKLKLPTGK